VLTEVLDRAGVMCRGVGGEVRWWGSMLRTRTGRCRDAPDSWAPRVDSRNTCGGATGVREVRGSLCWKYALEAIIFPCIHG